MRLRDRALGAVVTANNDHIRSVEGTRPNPRDLTGTAWHHRLVASAPAIRDEWETFVAAAGRTPRIEDVLDESQGNIGDWRFGLLVANGRTTEMARRWFPRTLAALACVDGLRAAMFSTLTAGAQLPEHCGPNAGVLRYHLGIDCGTDSALTVAGRVIPYRDDDGILFDDTAPHAARNDGPTDRVTLFCEITRPLPPLSRCRNAAVQRLLSLDPRYRHAVDRADDLDRSLNARATR